MDKNIKSYCCLCELLDKNDIKHSFNIMDEIYKCKKHNEYVSIENKICPPQLCDFIGLK